MSSYVLLASERPLFGRLVFCHTFGASASSPRNFLGRKSFFLPNGYWYKRFCSNLPKSDGSCWSKNKISKSGDWSGTLATCHGKTEGRSQKLFTYSQIRQTKYILGIFFKHPAPVGLVICILEKNSYVPGSANSTYVAVVQDQEWGSRRSSPPSRRELCGRCLRASPVPEK